MKNTATYWILVDGEKVDSFDALSTLSECQLAAVEEQYACKWGMKNFGYKGIQVKKARNENDYR